MSEWVAALDEVSGAYYYYNTETGETSWDPPEGGVAGAGSLFDEGKEDAAGAAPADEEEDWSPWAEEVDENGNVYYANILTGESSWTNPEEAQNGMGSGVGIDAGGGVENWTEQYDDEGNVCELLTGTSRLFHAPTSFLALPGVQTTSMHRRERARGILPPAFTSKRRQQIM